MNAKQAVSKLCLQCGLCCNGVLFRDVELQRGDDAEALARVGVDVQSRRRGRVTSKKFPQPCAALCDDLRCDVYSARPARCREFECALLQGVVAGEVGLESALARIRRAKAKVRVVERLLWKLGDARVGQPLKRRFQSLQRRLETDGCDAEAAGVFGELSECYHALGLLLAADFYA